MFPSPLKQSPKTIGMSLELRGFQAHPVPPTMNGSANRSHDSGVAVQAIRESIHHLSLLIPSREGKGGDFDDEGQGMKHKKQRQVPTRNMPSRMQPKTSFRFPPLQKTADSARFMASCIFLSCPDERVIQRHRQNAQHVHPKVEGAGVGPSSQCYTISG